MEKINLIAHYKKLFSYIFNRYKGNNYQQMRDYFARLLMAEVEPFMPLANKSVLDVGGARGEFCKVLHELRQCYAVSLDVKPQADLWDNSCCGRVEDLPFPEDTFDLVICRGVLVYVPIENQEKSVQELYRVTKPGGPMLPYDSPLV